MTKNKHTILTIAILLLLTFGLIFTFSTLNIDNNLKANNDNPTPTPDKPPFAFVGARNSDIDGVIFENNFGGSSNDEVNKVLTLDYNYVIGTTNSKDYYFENNSFLSSIYVLKITHSGNVINLALPNSQAGESSYADSYSTPQGVYILTSKISTNSLDVFFYSFSGDSLELVFSHPSANPISITKNEHLIINFSTNNKINTVFYNEDTKNMRTIKLPVNTNQTILTAPFKNGELIFFNTSDSFYSYFIDDDKATVLFMQQGFSLQNFTINSQGFILQLKTQTYQKIMVLDFSFNTLSEFKLSDEVASSKIATINENVYLVSTTNNSALNIQILSKRGDIVFNINRPELVHRLLLVKEENSNIQILYLTQENNLKILTLSSLTHTLNETLLPFSSNATIVDIDKTYDNNFILYGAITSSGNIIQNNFGNYDVFILKLSKNY